MRAFYLQWDIFQTPSGKFVAQAKGSPFSQLPDRSEDERPDTRLVPISEISDLAGGSRLPWSHYVQLLAVDNPNARGFYEAEAATWRVVRPAAPPPNRLPVLRADGLVEGQGRYADQGTQGPARGCHHTRAGA